MRHLTRIGVWAAVIAGWLFLCRPAHAQDPVHKVGRGLTNLLTCWLEIPKEAYQGTQEDNPVAGAVVGLFKGGVLTATRLLVGAYETVTFPIPYPKNYASPYEGLDLPDYLWE